jgi:hypothetical protein
LTVRNARYAGLILAALLGAAVALALASQSDATPPCPPCEANGDATTISVKTYSGSNGPDTIQASDKDNVIYGRGGDDTICAYLGKDRVYGGKGRDHLWGEAQNDKLYGGSQADVLRGGPDDDLCNGGGPRKRAGHPDPDTAIGCETRIGASKP